MADAALDVLGLGNYGSGEEDSEEDSVDGGEGTTVPEQPAPPPRRAAAPAAASLPDVGEMLNDMPQWEASEPAAAAHDRRGTNYNAVPLPSSLQREAVSHNRGTARGVASAGAASRESIRHSRAPVPVKRQAEPERSLLPPQLRRPNVTTEDQSSIRLAKRSKPADK
ncbi:hypothetical protein AB1Y20_020337 [Prymnesium parvum]|uniref:Uncharacterized protein n=1 Tax=Prymnesium parvum TaxID=97485 RepID=A0AB34JXQ4_PRYPA|mmetsp:Transcript_8542/g.21099  ORF Transcript_8542/g.21099 Transcript_8542/m.21099 type:complete len:167 (-) Transcript_8542:336-836(-)